MNDFVVRLLSDAVASESESSDEVMKNRIQELSSEIYRATHERRMIREMLRAHVRGRRGARQVFMETRWRTLIRGLIVRMEDGVAKDPATWNPILRRREALELGKKRAIGILEEETGLKL